MSDKEEITTEELPLESAPQLLRQAREAKRLTIEQVAAETRIPSRFLEIIEAGKFEELPGRTYAVGFSRTYAKQVGLDQEKIVQLVREDLGNRRGGHHNPLADRDLSDPAKVPSSALAWAGALGAVILAVGLIVYFGGVYKAGDDLPSLVNESASPASTGNGAEQSAANQAPAGDGQIVTDPIDPAGQVVFTALEDGIWARFYDIDGNRLLEKQMNAGERFEVPASAQEPRINTGRPDAFSITIGGKPVPKLAEEPTVVGDAPISAAALLARNEDSSAASSSTSEAL